MSWEGIWKVLNPALSSILAGIVTGALGTINDSGAFDAAKVRQGAIIGGATAVAALIQQLRGSPLAPKVGVTKTTTVEETKVVETKDDKKAE